MQTFLQQAARVCPSKKQLDWFAMESYAFVHFSPNRSEERRVGKECL